MIDNRINLMCGDCIELMQTIPNGSVDMVLCDLPYGVTQNKSDIVIPFDVLWEQYNRIIKDNGAIILFAQGNFYIDLVNSNRRMFRYDLVWDKGLVSGFLNANRMPLRQHEQLAVFYKKLPTYNPQMTKGKPLHSKGVNYKISDIVNNNYGKFVPKDDSRAGCTEKYPTSIVRFKKSHPSVCLHETEKPVALCEWLIKTYTNKDDTVLDNCMGSGTTGVACVNTDRKFIGIEKDEKYFALAKNRIEEAYNNG